jgi:hypothetical protein
VAVGHLGGLKKAKKYLKVQLWMSRLGTMNIACFAGKRYQNILLISRKEGIRMGSFGYVWIVTTDTSREGARNKCGSLLSNKLLLTIHVSKHVSNKKALTGLTM